VPLIVVELLRKEGTHIVTYTRNHDQTFIVYHPRTADNGAAILITFVTQR
jgi:hypothetical protein